PSRQASPAMRPSTSASHISLFAISPRTKTRSSSSLCSLGTPSMLRNAAENTAAASAVSGGAARRIRSMPISAAPRAAVVLQPIGEGAQPRRRRTVDAAAALGGCVDKAEIPERRQVLDYRGAADRKFPRQLARGRRAARHALEHDEPERHAQRLED